MSVEFKSNLSNDASPREHAPTITPSHHHTIPPHLAWPALVVFLLLIGIFSAFAALWAANSDGGAILVREPTEQVGP